VFGHKNVLSAGPQSWSSASMAQTRCDKRPVRIMIENSRRSGWQARAERLTGTSDCPRSQTGIAFLAVLTVPTPG
jgi:hypothetical protein